MKSLSSEAVVSDPLVDLFVRTKGVIITWSVPGSINEIANEDFGKIGECQREGGISIKVIPCVYYRTPETILLTMWRVTNLNSNNVFESLEIDSEYTDMIPSSSPIYSVALHESNFTKSTISLAFNSRGRVTNLTRGDEAAVKSASAAVGDSLVAGIDQLSTTLDKVSEIEETKSELQLQPIKSQIALAQQQLAFLNANTDLSVATQGQSSTIETRLAAIDAALVLAQGNLANVQSNFASQQANSLLVSQQTELTAQSSVLTAQINQIRQELELVKLRKEIDELRNAEAEN